MLVQDNYRTIFPLLELLIEELDYKLCKGQNITSFLLISATNIPITFVKRKFGIHSRFPPMQVSHGYYLASLVESKLTIWCGTELASAH